MFPIEWKKSDQMVVDFVCLSIKDVDSFCEDAAFQHV
jgi:hypothetical protein